MIFYFSSSSNLCLCTNPFPPLHHTPVIRCDDRSYTSPNLPANLDVLPLVQSLGYNGWRAEQYGFLNWKSVKTFISIKPRLTNMLLLKWLPLYLELYVLVDYCAWTDSDGGHPMSWKVLHDSPIRELCFSLFITLPTVIMLHFYLTVKIKFSVFFF